MVYGTAQCLLRVEPASPAKEGQTSPANSVLFQQPRVIDDNILNPQSLPLLSPGNYNEIPIETRLKWVTAITEDFLGPTKPDRGSGVRNFDYILRANGSIENISEIEPTPTTEEVQLREYPARYRIPNPIIENIDSFEEKIKRIELFALGCILYELISGNSLYPDLGDREKDDDEIQRRYAEGLFPEDVWRLDKAVRILASWCPQFAKELLEQKRNEPLRTKVGNYIKKHPMKFGLQVAGGIASLASLAVLPVLGVLGFAAAGPVAGSAAAGWQASVGLVQAGSLFSWCQSAAMGGAAVTGILATGLTGAGVAVSATVAGALDTMGDEEALPGLKEMFLEAWKRDVERENEEKSKL